MTTVITRQRLGDLLAEGEGSIRRELCYFDLGHLGDPEQSLLIMGAAADSSFRTHVYSRRDVERVQDLPVEEHLRVFERGVGDETFSPPEPGAGELRALETKDTEPDTKEDKSLQTASEISFSEDASLIEQVNTMFHQISLGECPADWQPATEVVHWPALNADGSLRNLPFMIIAHTCFFGNFGVVKTTVPIDDPMIPDAPQRIRVCRTHFKLEDVREVSLKHVVKVSKIGFGFTIGLSVLGGAGGLVPTGAQLGTPAFSQGQPVEEKKDDKKDDGATTGGGGGGGGGGLLDLQGSFNFSMVKQHASLKLKAWERLVADVGPEMFVCGDG